MSDKVSDELRSVRRAAAAEMAKAFPDAPWWRSGCMCPPGAEFNCRAWPCRRRGALPSITTNGTGPATPPASGGAE